MNADPVLHQVVQIPPPTGRRTAENRDRIYELLGGLVVGGDALEINRAPLRMKDYVYRYRQTHGRERSFIVRTSKPGWSRIWRVK